MFGGNSPRRQSVTSYPGAGYHQTPPTVGYDYGAVAGAGHVYGDQQWPGYPHLYGRYDEWNHHSAAAAFAAAQLQPPSPVAGAASSLEADTAAASTTGSLLYGNYAKPAPLCPPVGDFKPPLFGDTRPGQDGDGQGVNGRGGAHHSPDSGLAASDGVSGSDSPSHAQHPAQSSSPSLDHGLPSRPQPARSPYEWMKRPNIAARPCKEGSDGKQFSLQQLFIGCFILSLDNLHKVSYIIKLQF